MPVAVPVGELVLDVQGVSHGFGGVSALRDVALTVRADECVALIGPNGAGKSTLINCITGIYPIRIGSVRIEALDCTRRQPSELASLGVKRTFQNIETFPRDDGREVLAVGAHHLGSTSMLAGVFGSRRVAIERARIADRDPNGPRPPSTSTACSSTGCRRCPTDCRRR